MSRRHSRRQHHIDAVIDCLMRPAWELSTLGDPKAPTCYLVRQRPPDAVADVKITDTVVEHRFYTHNDPEAKATAKFALKSLIAEQIVDAINAYEAKFVRTAE